MKENIIIFGFSGSGKSSVADALGRRLKRRVIHPSSILRELLEGKKPNLIKTKAGRGFWESAAGVRLFTKRLESKQPLDLICDQILLDEIVAGGIIIDSWSLPWLTPNGIKIYLKANRALRCQRILTRTYHDLTRARNIIRLKDIETRKLYLSHKGFDIAKDTGVFDLVINTAQLTKKEVTSRILSFLTKRGKNGKK